MCSSDLVGGGRKTKATVLLQHKGDVWWLRQLFSAAGEKTADPPAEGGRESGKGERKRRKEGGARLRMLDEGRADRQDQESY